MSSSFVWVQLYYKGKAESEGRPTSVKKPTDLKESDWNIDALAEAVKDKRQVALNHCDAADLAVYLADAMPPFSQAKAIDPGDDVPTSTTSRNPLIVLAPNPKQANGKKCFKFGSFMCLLLIFFNFS